MHTVELLEHALSVAGLLGIKLRMEWLGGTGGGGCEIHGQKCIFLDLAQSPSEQLEQVLAALRGEPGLAALEMPLPLRHLLGLRKVA